MTIALLYEDERRNVDLGSLVFLFKIIYSVSRLLEWYFSLCKGNVSGLVKCE